MDVMALLFNWWREPNNPIESVFVPDLLTSTDDSVGDAHEFIKSARSRIAPWQDLKVLSMISAGSQAAVVFEGVEPFTLLWHRVAWHVAVKNQRVASIWQVTEIIGSQRRPSEDR
jgi:hypothetical protein